MEDLWKLQHRWGSWILIWLQIYCRWLRCPWLLFPCLHPGIPHALNCCTVPQVLHQSLLPPGPSPPKIPMCHASSAALLVNWGEWQPAGVKSLTQGPKLQTPLHFNSASLLWWSSFFGNTVPTVTGQGWASCRWWDLQSLLLKRCTKHSCEVEMTSGRRCAFASWMWYYQVLIKAATADY